MKPKPPIGPLVIADELTAILHEPRCSTGHVRIRGHDKSQPKEYSRVYWLTVPRKGPALQAGTYDTVSILNTDEAGHTLTLLLDGMEIHSKVLLGPGDRLDYEEGKGWEFHKWEG